MPKRDNGGKEEPKEPMPDDDLFDGKGGNSPLPPMPAPMPTHPTPAPMPAPPTPPSEPTPEHPEKPSEINKVEHTEEPKRGSWFAGLRDFIDGIFSNDNEYL